MTDAQRRSRATEAFFGRRKGKPLRERQAQHLETLLPELKVDLSTAAEVDLSRAEAELEAVMQDMAKALEEAVPGLAGITEEIWRAVWPLRRC